MTAWSTKAPRSRSIPRRRSVSTAARPRAFSRSDSKRTRASPRSSPPVVPSSASAASTDVSSSASVLRSRFSSVASSARAAPPSARRRCSVVSSRPARNSCSAAQLGDDVAVAASRVGLALERAQLAAHLAQEVAEAGEVALGGGQAALGLLLALAVLQDAGGLFEDQPAVLGAGVEHRVDLALADDHVLLAADARVGQQLLDVEQPAGHAVDGVLAVARAEQRAGDRDLGELDREQPGRVVDRERHLGPTERRPLGGAGEDDVVHLLGAHGGRAPGRRAPSRWRRRRWTCPSRWARRPR